MGKTLLKIVAAAAALLVLMTLGKKAVSMVIVQRVIDRWLPLVQRYQKFYPKIPVSRILAHIAQESAGDSAAEGDRVNGIPQAFGLMQMHQAALTDFNKAFGRSYTMQQLKEEPFVQVEAGIGFLELKRRAAGSLAQASRDYNDGNPHRDNLMSLGYGKSIEAYNAAFSKELGNNA